MTRAACRIKMALLAIAFAGSACVAEPARPDLNGVWLMEGLAQYGQIDLTKTGQRLKDAYNLLTDDPDLRCAPASLARVWGNPSVRVGIEQSEDHVLISYEFFDLRRDVPLGRERKPSDTPSTHNVSGEYFPEMGSSVGWYEGDRLFIKTQNHATGYIRTSNGIPQSEHSVATEEIWREDDTLNVKMTYVDESLFKKPVVIMYKLNRMKDDSVPLYDCKDAGYDWFEKLNAPKKEAGH